MREAVYQRARAALARQLTAVVPPLSAREIEAQHQELEDAVARLEADFAPEELGEPAEDFQDEEVYTPPPPSRPMYQEPSFSRTEVETRSASRRDYGASDEQDEDDFEDEDEEEDARPSRAPALVGVLLLLLVVAGVGAYGYAERDTLFGFIGGGDRTAEGEPPVRVVTPEPAPLDDGTQVQAGAADSAGDKRPDRLTNGTEPPAEAIPADTALLEPAPPLEPAEPDIPVEPLAPADPGEEQTAALNAPADSIVAQRAIYYFQGAEGSPGQATEGTVAWSQMTKESGPAIQATLRLTGQDTTTTVTISRNSDSSLPASHLVEVQFSGALGASAVQRVPALVMKTTEQARGQPLTGAAVPVTDDLFWIALSDDAEQVTRNLQLLREGSWFDIPILFEDGTRALLTFEKGVPGDKVFQTVISSWTPT